MIRGALLGLTISLSLADAARAGSARCWIDNGALVVSGSFGDIAGDFLVDTAAPYSQINTTEAQAAGYEGAFATAPLRMAGLSWVAVRWPLVSLDALPPRDTAIVGVIGEDVLSDYELRVRFSPCRLVLARPLPRRSGRALKVRWLSGLPTIETRYGDGVMRRSEPMLISTGRWESLVPRALLSRSPAPGSTAPVRLGWISIGGKRFVHAPAELAEAPVGSLGMSVLTGWRGFQLTNGRVVLEP